MDHGQQGQPEETAEREPLAEEPTAEYGPMEKISHELILIANGASVQLLRTRVTEIFPKDREEGQAFLRQLIRLRDAAEVALTTGREMQFSLER